jgi:hypothetical protein
VNGNESTTWEGVSGRYFHVVGLAFTNGLWSVGIGNSGIWDLSGDSTRDLLCVNGMCDWNYKGIASVALRMKAKASGSLLGDFSGSIEKLEYVNDGLCWSTRVRKWTLLVHENLKWLKSHERCNSTGNATIEKAGLPK